MDIRQLKYFLAIAEEGQITSAAKKLNIAQPPLSQQLKLLEKELGVKLVERGPRYIKLTGAGEILRERASQILELSHFTVSEIGSFNKGLSGKLAVGVVSSSDLLLLKDKFVNFHKKYSGVKLELYEGNIFSVFDLLSKGIIEVAIVRTPFKASNLEYRYIGSEPMIAVFSNEYPFDTVNSHISIDELKEKPLIIYRRFEELIKEACLQNGFEPEVFCKNDDAYATMFLASVGMGIGIVPKSACELFFNSGLLSKEIKNEKLRTRLAVVKIREKYISSLAAKFMDCLNEE